MMYVLDVFLFFDFLSFLKDCFLSAKVNLKEIHEQSQKVLCLKRSAFLQPF